MTTLFSVLQYSDEVGHLYLKITSSTWFDAAFCSLGIWKAIHEGLFWWFSFVLSYDAAMPMNQKLSIPTLQMQCKVITFSAFLYSSSDI